jgi:fatty-acyl-CoA synthase
MVEAHYEVPLSGAILNTINHRLDAEGIAFILRHSECKLLLVDCEYIAVASLALEKPDTAQ